MLLRFDKDADALYIELNPGLVARTRQIDEGTLVDVDAAGAVVGIEIIRPARDWPVRKVVEEFHVEDSAAVQLLSLWERPEPAGTWRYWTESEAWGASTNAMAEPVDAGR
jgi:uncharacterized protein YuzE